MQKSTNRFLSLFLFGIISSVGTACALPSLAVPLPPLQEPRKPIEFPKPLEPSESPLQPLPTLPVIPTNSELPNLKAVKFIFIGNTVISTKELEDATAFLLNKQLSPEDLQRLQKTITDLYVSKGFINSGAFINKANNALIKSDNAVLTIKIIEGGLEDFTINGSHRLKDYLIQQLDIDQSKPFNSKKLLNNLLILQDDPLISEISAKIEPANDPELINAVRLNVDVKSKNPYRVEAFVDNNGNNSSGSFRQGILFEAGNPFGRGDNLGLIYAHTDGTNALNFRYSIPLVKNFTAKINASYGSNLITQAPFGSLDIRGTSYNVDFSLDQLIYQKATERSRTEVGISAGFRYSRVDESILGIPFQVSEGATANGVTDLKVFHLDQYLSYRDRVQAVSVNSSILGGVDLASATAPLYHNGAFIGWQGDAGVYPSAAIGPSRKR